MGPLAYYAPLWLGTLLTAALVAVSHSELAELAPLHRALWLLVYPVATGLWAQTAMIGAQGVFAQVLPAPGGRSIRGPSAVLAGAFTLVFVSALPAAVFLSVQGQHTPAFWAQCVSGGALVVAGISYFWAWPTADRDFASERGLP